MSQRRSRSLAGLDAAGVEPLKRQRDSKLSSSLAPQQLTPKHCVFRALSRWRFPTLAGPLALDERRGIFPNVPHAIRVVIASYLGLKFLRCAAVSSDWLKGCYFTWPNITALRMSRAPPEGLLCNFNFQHGETLIIDFPSREGGGFHTKDAEDARCQLISHFGLHCDRLSHVEISWTDYENDDTFERAVKSLIPTDRRLKTLKLNTEYFEYFEYMPPTHALHDSCDLDSVCNTFEHFFGVLRRFKGVQYSVAMKVASWCEVDLGELGSETVDPIMAMVIEEVLPTWGLLVELDFFPGRQFICGEDIARFPEALALHCPNLTKLRFKGLESLTGWEPTRDGWFHKILSQE